MTTFSPEMCEAVALKILEKKARDGEIQSLPEGVHNDVSFTLAVNADKVAVKAPQEYTATVGVSFTKDVVVPMTEAHAEAFAIYHQAMVDALVDAGTRCGRGEGWAATVAANALELAYGAGVQDAETAALSILTRASKREASPAFAARCKAAWDAVFKPSVEKKTRAGTTTINGGKVRVME